MTDVLALREMVEALVEAGVTDVVVCPGSRSTPLALATRAHPGLTVRVLLDERSAGFFALGLARASRRPVAVVVTSGTAVANLLPSVVEASLARVPLVLLTADRPPELRDRGAPQTIDQVRIFGGHVRWFAELPLLDGAPETRRHAGRSWAGPWRSRRGGRPGRSTSTSAFREPLVPSAALGPIEAVGETEGASRASTTRPFTDVVGGRAELSASEVGWPRGPPVVRRARPDPGRSAGRPGLPAALARLAAATGYPIVADPLSLVRCGPHDRSHVVSHGDHLVRPGAWRDAHLPELVIRFGATPTSKPLLTMLADAEPSAGRRRW